VVCAKQVEAHPLIHAVAYSLHSCVHEIEAYEKLVQPRFIAGQQISLQEGEASTDPEVVLAHLARDSQRMGKFTGSPLHRLMQQLPKAQVTRTATRLTRCDSPNG
jgi:3-keto-L-gulonate-6-phosphate decarboxylase